MTVEKGTEAEVWRKENEKTTTNVKQNQNKRANLVNQGEFVNYSSFSSTVCTTAAAFLNCLWHYFTLIFSQMPSIPELSYDGHD